MYSREGIGISSLTVGLPLDFIPGIDLLGLVKWQVGAVADSNGGAAQSSDAGGDRLPMLSEQEKSDRLERWVARLRDLQARSGLDQKSIAAKLRVGEVTISRHFTGSTLGAWTVADRLMGLVENRSGTPIGLDERLETLDIYEAAVEAKAENFELDPRTGHARAVRQLLRNEQEAVARLSEACYRVEWLEREIARLKREKLPTTDREQQLKTERDNVASWRGTLASLSASVVKQFPPEQELPPALPTWVRARRSTGQWERLVRASLAAVIAGLAIAVIVLAVSTRAPQSPVAAPANTTPPAAQKSAPEPMTSSPPTPSQQTPSPSAPSTTATTQSSSPTTSSSGLGPGDALTDADHSGSTQGQGTASVVWRPDSDYVNGTPTSNDIETYCNYCPSSDSGYTTVILNKKYSTITAILGVESHSTPGVGIKITIFADQTQIYSSSFDVNHSKNIDLKVAGANQLRIDFDGDFQTATGVVGDLTGYPAAS